MKKHKIIEKILKDTKFVPMDFCQICGKYDTIQTYIPTNVTFNGTPIWIHVCEECAKKKEPS